MEPIKFEKDIKAKLDERTLQPSEDAWNKLSKRLDENNKRNNKTVWWFGVAASVVAVLLIASQFFKNEVEAGDNHQIVVTPEVINEDKPNQIANEENVIIPEVLEEEVSAQTKPTRQIVKKQAVTKISKAEFNTKNGEVAQTNKTLENKPKIIQSKQIIKKQLTFEDQKIQSVVAQVKRLKENDIIVTDKTIDALLAEAQKEIALDRLYNKKTGIVDANLLLQDVEADLLEQSFRDKVFKALKEGYGSVKLAVAQRNN